VIIAADGRESNSAGQSHGRDSRHAQGRNYAGFQCRGIPLVHQIAVAGPFRRRGVATLLMDAAEQLARDRGVVTLGITVGLFDEYGPAQRLYGRRGYIPDGRGACQGQRPLSKGARVTMDHDLIMWLTKDLVG